MLSCLYKCVQFMLSRRSQRPNAARSCARSGTRWWPRRRRSAAWCRSRWAKSSLRDRVRRAACVLLPSLSIILHSIRVQSDSRSNFTSNITQLSRHVLCSIAAAAISEFGSTPNTICCCCYHSATGTPPLPLPLSTTTSQHSIII